MLAETLRSLVREEMAPHVLEIRAAEIVSQTVTRHVDALQVFIGCGWEWQDDARARAD
eukprot:SAG25_NODE_84_length_16553_cov_5.346238_25_plen_58_part_00